MIDNRVPGARAWETPEETEERKWIAYLIRRRPRVLGPTERRVLDLMFALEDGTTRSTCSRIAEDAGVTQRDVHRIAEGALVKIDYLRLSDRTPRQVRLIRAARGLGHSREDTRRDR